MSWSQNGEDDIAASCFDASYQGTVLEIGAWFPAEFSNSRLLIDRGWHAVLVELSPLPLDRLIRAHALNNKVKIIAAAVTQVGMHIQPFAITEDALSSSMPGTRERWRGMREGYDGGFYGELWVPTITLPEIYMQFFSANWPDVVSIDTEGTSFYLLPELLKLHTPKVIIIEHDGRIVEMAKIYEPAGYVVRQTTTENLVLVKE